MAKKLFSVIAIGFFCIWALTAQNALPAYGNAAAKADPQLTIESMLMYAIQDEYMAEAEHTATNLVYKALEIC